MSVEHEYRRTSFENDENKAYDENEAAVAAASAETGLIHLPTRHGDEADEEEVEPAVAPTYPTDAEARDARSEELEELEEPEDFDSDRPYGSGHGVEPALEPEEELPEQVSTYDTSDDLSEPASTPVPVPTPEPSATTATAAVTSAPTSANRTSGTDYDARMRAIQVTFIDDPRRAALDSDDLLAEVLQTFADDMASRRREIETEPTAGAAPDTEKLRLAVRRSRELVGLLAPGREEF